MLLRIMFLHEQIKRVPEGNAALLRFGNRDTRIEIEFEDVLADQFKTKAVQRADVRGIKAGELFWKPLVCGLAFGIFFESLLNAFPYLGGGGLCEGNDE